VNGATNPPASRGQGTSVPFIGDQPISLEKDVFGHSDYARALAGMVSDPEPPSTIGLFGSWGVGKSTIIDGLRDQLDGRVAFAYFDAWRYEEDSLRRQFLRDVGRELKDGKHLALCKFDPDKDLSELDTDQQHTDEAFSLSWPRVGRALLIASVMGAITFTAIKVGVLADFVKSDSFGKQFAPSAGATLVGFLAGLFGQSVHIAQRLSIVKSLADPDRFQSKFMSLVKAVRQDRLVIAIDNLDRSSPEKAVEMLSTIKTYLEPAIEISAMTRTVTGAPRIAKKVVFIVAVDDAALRRHLIARELSHPNTAGGEADASRYADEYLAKFFSVRLPIRRILGDDMRTYVGEHLENLISRRGHSEVGTRLIGLASTALRRNPRRIKQFVNDLEARLRLLEEREKAPPGGEPGIAAPVSREILMVAKLILIESEWPTAFAQLQREPKRLAEWHVLAETDDEVPLEGASVPPSQNDQEAARAFASFLRASRSIDSVYLRALIDLRQAPVEAGLDGFAEFRQAVISGERSEAQRLIETAPEADRPAYAERLTSVLKDELDQGDYDAARAVVDASLSVDAISVYGRARTAVLSMALSQIKFYGQLRQLDPGAAIAAGRDLPEVERERLHSTFISRMLDDQESSDSQARVAEALATVAGDLSANLTSRLRDGLAQPPLADQFEVYGELGEADPDILPVDTAPRAFTVLQTSEAGIHLAWDAGTQPSESAFRVLLVALGHKPQPDIEPPLFDYAIQSLVAMESNEEMLERVIDRIQLVIDGMQTADRAHPGRLATHLQQRWPAYPSPLRPKVATLLGAALDHTTEEIRGAVAPEVVNQIFADPGSGIAFVNASAGVPEVLLPQIAERLENLLSEASQRDNAATALERLSLPDLSRHVANGTIASVRAGDFDGAVSLIDRYENVLAPHGAEMADAVLDHAQVMINQGGLPPFQVLARLGRWMKGGQQKRLAEMVSTRFAGAHADAPAAVEILAQERGTERAIDVILETSISNLEAMPQIVEVHMPMLDLVARHSERLEPSRLDGLLTRLEIWISGQPDQRAAVAGRVARLANLTAGQRERVVRFLIATEKSEADPVVRVELLRAANEIRGKDNSRATRALEERISELEEGAEADELLARQVRDAPNS
jgi:hypothetical protein